MPALRKLTDDEIAAIRAAWLGWNATELALQYGISKQWIMKITKGEVRKESRKLTDEEITSIRASWVGKEKLCPVQDESPVL